MKAVIALGGNLGDPQSIFDAAEAQIEQRIGRITRRSTRYWTEPLLDPDMPVHGQPSFLNSAVLVRSALAPAGILSSLLDIEQLLGRTRGLRWGPRLIDLDLIAYEEYVISQPGLTVPHPEMHKRSFVLEPLVEIWPDWTHPILHETAVNLLAQLECASARSATPKG